MSTPPTHEVRRLLADLASDPAIEQLGDETAYRALRAGLSALLRGLERPSRLNDSQFAAEEHLRWHCALCGEALPFDMERAGTYPRCCAACIAAGRAADAPLLDPEVPLAPSEREALLGSYFRAAGCAESGAVEAAWQLLEQAGLQVEQIQARPAMIAVWLLAGEVAARRGDGRYARKLLRRCVAYGEQIGDARSIERAEALLETFDLHRFDEGR